MMDTSDEDKANLPDGIVKLTQIYAQFGDLDTEYSFNPSFATVRKSRMA